MKTILKQKRNFMKVKRGNKKFRTQNRTLLYLSDLHTNQLRLKLIKKHPSDTLLSIVSDLVPGIGLEPIRTQCSQDFKSFF